MILNKEDFFHLPAGEKNGFYRGNHFNHSFNRDII